MALKPEAIDMDTVTDEGGSDKTLIVASPGPGEAKLSAAVAPLPFIGGKPTQEQFKILAALAGVFVLLAIIMLMLTARSNSHGASYISAAGQMRMLSQRIAKAAQVSLLGNQAALTELGSSRAKFAELLPASRVQEMTLRRVQAVASIRCPPE